MTNSVIIIRIYTQGKSLDRLNAKLQPISSVLDFFGDNLVQDDVTFATDNSVETMSSKHTEKKPLKRKQDKDQDAGVDIQAKKSKLNSNSKIRVPRHTWLHGGIIISGDDDGQSDVSNSDDNEEAVTLLPGHAPLDIRGGKRHKAKRRKLKQKAKKMDNEKQALLRLQEVLIYMVKCL